MRDIESSHMTWILSIASGVALILFLYLVVAFFRLDWVVYDTVERYWEIEAMECVDQPVEPVFMFFRHRGSKPEFSLHFSRSMYRHLRKQNSDTIEVNRRLVGYLSEWDYGIIVPQSVAGKRVQKTSLISQESLSDCNFKIDEKLKAKLVSTRRKMR